MSRNAGEDQCCDPCYHGLAGLHILVGLNQEAREMTIDSFQTILMAHDDIETITTTLKTCQAHTTRESRIHSVTDCRTQVNTFVGAAKLGTPTIL